MSIFLVFFIMFCITAVISWLWVRGISNMKENHPDYDGKDLFGEEDDEYEN